MPGVGIANMPFHFDYNVVAFILEQLQLSFSTGSNYLSHLGVTAFLIWDNCLSFTYLQVRQCCQVESAKNPDIHCCICNHRGIWEHAPQEFFF